MAKWILGGVTLDINPSEDTGWNVEPVYDIQHVPGSNYDLIQTMGNRSAKREARGTTKSSSVKSNLSALIGTSVAFTDHYSVSNTVFVAGIVFAEKMDVSNLGVGTFAYTISLIKVT